MIRRYVHMALTFMLASACTEVVDLNVDERTAVISIYGRFNNGALGNQVTLSRTSNYTLPPNPISNARIRVYNKEDDFVSFKESEEERGTYLIDEHNFQGEVGEDYLLEVTLITGQTYRSTWQTLPPKRAIDYLDFEIGQVQKTTESGQFFEFLGATIYQETELLDKGKDIYLRWDIETSWLYREALLPPQFFF